MKKKSRKPLDELGNKVFFAGLIALLIGFAAAILYSYYGEKIQEKVFESLATQTKDVRILLSDMNADKVRFYSYLLPGNKSIKFFVTKTSENKVRIAFDACQDCYKSHLGYGQSGKDIICILCKRRIKGMNHNQSGCSPLALKSTVENGQIVIKLDDLKEGFRYFQ